jgi:NAD dependent epimerase/dehydratase family enzyme
MGEMAELLTSSQRVTPARLRQVKFEFKQPALEDALRDLTRGTGATS